MSSTSTVVSPLIGTVLYLRAEVGEAVQAGAPLVVLESMKMEHVVAAGSAGTVVNIACAPGDTVEIGSELVTLGPGTGSSATSPAPQATGSAGGGASATAAQLDAIRPELADSVTRHAYGLDENRPQAVAKRHGTGKRTARENIADLVDEGTFAEYGPLVVAAQRKRRPIQDLIERTPADGLVGGIGEIDGQQCVIATYDYMVLAGTQGHQNHRKKDRLFELAAELKLPLVLFAEGGGGRPGDTDGVAVAGLDCLAFSLLADLSGQVPIIGINAGYCFAGNAALLGCCDVIISTENANLGMAGPAMIEGGGLGVFAPTDIGTTAEQVATGVIDLLVEDEAAAVAAAKRLLAGWRPAAGSHTGVPAARPGAEWAAPDERLARHAVPESRREVYDVHAAIDGIVDVGSALELRPEFAPGMVTVFATVEGGPVGIIANNPVYLAGAIDSDCADKAARFMQLCDARRLPILFLCDTPGFMVGPDVERTGLVRHAGRLFVTSSSITVPFATVVLRKGYGLGAQAMAGGSFKRPVFTVAWPTSEFGGMNLEGFVHLGYRKELEAISDPAEREAEYEKLLAKLYEAGKGLSMADHFEIDDVIDPADTRRWATMLLRAAQSRPGKGRTMIDPW